MLALALEDLLLERDRDLTDQVGTLKARTGSENSTELLKSVSLPMPWGLVLFFLLFYIICFLISFILPSNVFPCIAKDEATTSSTLS